MKLDVLLLSPRSLSFEIKAPEAYEAKTAYEIYLDGVLLRKDKRQVQSLYGLRPGRDYCLEVRRGELLLRHEFTTPDELYTLDVRDFGAKGDGEADDTQPIQAALYACPPQGRVYVPEGRYKISSLYFKSHTRFELAEGAVLEAFPGRSGRALLPGFVRDFRGGKYHLGSWEGNPLDCYAGILTLLDVEDVLIYGRGTVEGGGSAEGWWKNPKERVGAWRPRSVFMRRCRNVRIQGITIRNSPSWTVHPMESENLDFINLSIQNPWDSPNTDGINPEACTGVRILGCRFSLGDDCIALKSGKVYMARESGRPCRKISIRNCLMEDGHGGLTIGSEMAGGVREVEVKNCIFRRTDRGLRIKTRRGRGDLAVVSDIRFDNIEMEKVLTPFVVNMFYFCDPDGHSRYVQCKEDVGGPEEDLPAIGALRFENIKAEDCRLCGLFAYGLPERPIEEIALKNVELSFVPRAERAETEPAMLDDDEWQQGDLLYVRNVKKFSCENLVCHFREGERMVLEAAEEKRRGELLLPPER